MLAKNQKTWMWVFIAMFAIPEILWSPISNFYYELLQTSKTSFVQPLRTNFLLNADNINYLRFVLFLQLIATLILFIFNIKSSNNILIRIILSIMLFFLVIFVGFALYYSVSFSLLV